mgnify:CR=1 FL=1
MNFNDLPAIGQPLDAGTFVGLTTKPDGTHHAVVLLADKPEKRLTWKASLAMAQFESDWHWTSDAYDSSCAWFQGFYYGRQYYFTKSFEARARAVRLIQLTL